MASLSTLRVLAAGDPHVFAEAIKRFGLKVVGYRNNDPLETRVQSESITSIASTLTEDVDGPVSLPRATIEAMRIAEDHGYIVKILEGFADGGEGEIGGGVETAPPPTRTRPGSPTKKPKEKRKPFNPPRPQKEPNPKACGGM